MGRAERRRLEKQRGKQVKTYNLTRSQLHNAVRQVTGEDLKRIKQEAMEDAMNSVSIISMVYEVKPIFFRGRVREDLWRKLRDQYLNVEAEIEIER